MKRELLCCWGVLFPKTDFARNTLSQTEGGHHMCAIAGWLDFKTNITGNDAVLEAMSKTLKRRGPDSHGEYKVTEPRL